MQGVTQDSSKSFRQGDPLYEFYRRSYVNGNVPARYPREIVRPSTAEEVAVAIKRANTLKIPVGVRSGGHHFACTSLLEDGLLIDTSEINRCLNYDKDAHTIDFGPAVRVKEAAATLLEVGRFFPYGHAPTVALGGFSLAGGQGWFMRGWGATCETWITQMEIVTANGDIVLANAERNEDLFWAARGSGQMFFGVVTRMWARTMPARKLFHRTLLFRIGDLFEKILEFVLERSKKTEKFGIDIACCTFYSEKYDPSAQGDGVLNRSVLLAVEVVAYCGSFSDAEILLDQWADIPEYLATNIVRSDPVRPSTWDELFAAQDALVNCGTDNYWDCDSILNDPTVPLSKVIEDHITLGQGGRSNKKRIKLIQAIKPALCNLPTRQSVGCLYIGDTYPREGSCAFSLPQQYYIATFTGWTEPSREPNLRIWMQEAYVLASTVSCGMYVADYDSNRRKTKIMSSAALHKFLQIRKKWDPQEIFPAFRGLTITEK